MNQEQKIIRVMDQRHNRNCLVFGMKNAILSTVYQQLFM
jgi:hypothetical protein